MKITSPYFKRPEQIAAESLAPKVDAILRGNINKRVWTYAQIEAEMTPEDAAVMTRGLMFLVAGILGVEIDTGN